MALDDILRQNAEITDLLHILVELHGRALQDQGPSDRLEGIRRDILICFNDLCTLNDMLTSCDGEIRDEIQVLQKAKDKFTRLNRKRQLLLKERDKWTEETPVSVKDQSEQNVVVDTRYRRVLDQYLDLVGANNTTLVEDHSQGDVSRETVLQSVKVLHSCHDNVLQSVKQLKELLNDITKDQAFIEKEMKAQVARIRRETSAIDDELRKNSSKRKNLLAKVGLALPDETSTAQKLFHLKLNDQRDKQLELEQEDIASHANEFLDMKIASLQDQLTHRKDDSYQLIHVRDSWSDCVDSVKNLEDRLRSALTGDLTELPTDRVGSWIKENIEELSSIISSTNNRILITLVSHEREVIENAYDEISQSSKPIEPSSPIRNKHSSPPFLVANKSPPKIGLSDKTAQSLSNNNGASGSNSLTMLKDKSQKKD
ncbi:Atg23p TDEL_0D01070 [Torulaspora delbrueckii]|uniref:Autophagy-related protein 23 n=1 Tax=Torulaspora delbrueckii TaxID=4950 RepID=G8ZSU7_TORDE|nr:hypothetical protein TDEL_0D01070 [Torulaspora delbrueckii]CCE91691.1 hypothetical protein TDEL_0D01070 [Torulaspora delbrueckii]